MHLYVGCQGRRVRDVSQIARAYGGSDLSDQAWECRYAKVDATLHELKLLAEEKNYTTTHYPFYDPSFTFLLSIRN